MGDFLRRDLEGDFIPGLRSSGLIVSTTDHSQRLASSLYGGWCFENLDIRPSYSGQLMQKSLMACISCSDIPVSVQVQIQVFSL